jgi:methionyl-tRNA formyltransferase
MRIVFVGTVEFSRRTLEAVLDAGGDVVGVLTLAPEDGTFHSDYADLGPLAADRGVPLRRIRRLDDDETIEVLRRLEPDVVFVFGWSQLLPREVLELPSLGCVGTHPALLPQGRGRHPLVWTLVEGLERSGLTFLYLDEGVDSGDILWQRSFEIELEDDAAALYRKIEELAVAGICEFLPQLEAGTAPRIAQDPEQATHWRKRDDDDRRIDWAASTLSIYNLVRALARPYVGATTVAAGRELVLWRARLPEAPLDAAARAAVPGTILRHWDSSLEVRTGDSSLVALEIEPFDSAVLRPGQILGAVA